MKIFKKTIYITLSVYVLFCLAVYLKPESFFYNAAEYIGNIENVQKDGFDVKEVVYHKYSDIDAKGWLYLNTTPSNNDKVILFLHGNSHNIEKYYHKLIPLAKTGYSVFIPEYRGFGGQGKKIRQANLTQDAINALFYLNGLGFENKNVIVYGMSLGTHMALYTTVHAQKQENINALILEVPFTSLLDTVKYHTTYSGVTILPLDLLVKDKYNNLELINQINTRLLVMTTKSDTLIPYAQATMLYEKAPLPKELKIYNGASHDSLFNLSNYEYVIEWLDK